MSHAVDLNEKSEKIPFEEAGILSRISFYWMNGLLEKGYNKPLEARDIPQLPHRFSCQFALDTAKEMWGKEITKTKPNLVYSLLKSFWSEYMTASVVFCPYIAVCLLQPYFVSSLLQYVTTGSVSFLGVTSGIGLAFFLGAVSLIAVTAYSSSFFLNTTVAIPIRNAIIALIFQKSMRLSNSSRAKYSTGSMVTMISVDVERIFQGLLFTNWLWAGPILALVAMILLIVEVGIAGVTALIVMLLLNVIQTYIGSKVGEIRKRQVKYTAERVKVTNEILQGIRVIKLYAWEIPITKRIEQLRALEVKELTTYQMARTATTAFMFMSPLLVGFTLFITYIYLDTRPILTVPKVYTTYALLNVIRLPLAVTPLAWTCLIEALVCAERITKFLLLEEIDNNHLILDSTAVDVTESSDVGRYPLVVLKNAEFYWGASVTASSATDEKKIVSKQADSEKTAVVESGKAGPEDVEESHVESPALFNINLEIYNTDFIAIVGSVGSGKTSLVCALTNQLHMTKGQYFQRSDNLRIAYVAQEHWIQNINLRDNILFDMPMDEELYCQVMDASQLSKDLLVLPHADMTFIGERGLNLSGGQKARVNIARALYAKQSSDLFIFDDSLAAVDVHVGRALFDEAICGMVRDKCRIVVLSSNYHFLERFTKIVVMEKGTIAMVGTYEEVVAKFPQYSGVHQCEGSASPTIDTNISDKHQDQDILIDCGTPLKPPPLDNAEGQVSLFRQHSNTITEKQEEAQNLMSEEDREKGAVSMNTYVNYFAVSSIQTSASQTENENKGNLSGMKYWRGFAVLLGILTLFAASQTGRVFSDLWIGLYAASLEQGSPVHTPVYFMTWYFVFVWGTIFLVIVRSYCFIVSCLGASRKLHEILLTSVLSAPVNTYFDITPVGRILNRFSKDLDSMDALLPEFLLNATTDICQCLSIICVCLSSTPYFVLLLLPLSVLFYMIQSYFRKSCREMKRLESIARSPMYSLFGEYVQMQNFFVFFMSTRWLALRLDIVSNFVVIAISVLGVVMRDSGGAIDPNILGIAIVYALQLTAMLQWTVRMTIEAETNATSVERLLAFVDIEPEHSVISNKDGHDENGHFSTHIKELNDNLVGDIEMLSSSTSTDKYTPLSTESVDVVAGWPTMGEIRFDNLKLRYRPDLDLVLHGINYTIPGGTKVGVVGRTAAGKSSLMLSLFRIIEPEAGSSILIDGVNIQSVPLQQLRSGVTIIPQDPFMFSGTLRSNLDPFDIYSDEAIWEALDRTHLKQDVLEKFPLKLQHEISERGENISVGQRQMVCIARALLRNSKIIIMDEATASVDSTTDRKIQVTIREEFKNCTVLTIAHRLETIADFDLVLVMENGLIVEAGSPLQLLGLSEQSDLVESPLLGDNEKKSIFRGFVNELGAERKAQFVYAAKNRELMNISVVEE